MFINVIAASLEKVDQYNNDDSDGLSTIYSGQDSDGVFLVPSTTQPAS